MLFDLFRSPVPKDFFEGACDMHSHLLPGVDDGFSDFDKTMEGLSLLKEWGYAKVKMTPHFMRDYQNNTREAIETKYQEFLAKAGDSLPVELSLGGEYMLDSCFMDRFEEGFLTLDAAHSLVLCETSYMMVEPQAREMLYQVMLKGYRPVIAHPERYNYASMALYNRWKERDYLLQLNLLSLAGAYGDVAQSKARQLLKEGLYDYVGTDLHRVARVGEMITSIRLSSKERGQLEILLERNKTL
jgi:tyrosine-protein phosphatase YwqE